MEDHKTPSFIASLWQALFASLVHLYSRLFRPSTDTQVPGGRSEEQYQSSPAAPPPPSGSQLGHHNDDNSEPRFVAAPQESNTTTVDSADLEHGEAALDNDESMAAYRKRGQKHGPGSNAKPDAHKGTPTETAPNASTAIQAGTASGFLPLTPGLSSKGAPALSAGDTNVTSHQVSAQLFHPSPL